ncbi:NAD(P)-dependent dehydrogenase (short-subunit alcohol dehydrogenase family) [Rhodoferax saidenbachensis]|uniref:NAD(P)-dependent dehydrogenase (Short-subunit alcohol dehydrogenase family) n=1 Tax=Rhodoferax saidenbachensis TaxID=1484693 RepID=A0ABU1ZR98_9BURK|nr:NAD(P)-dependent dehydrogenase (short-subunit alcohol dehydrogenase family) [Rhodoferax saidenbachensis]
MNVFVIGASRGIGLEVVRQHLEAGDRVIATARDDAGLQRLRDLGAQAMKLDVADPASVSGLSWALDGEKLDLAYYVAGVFSTEDAQSPPTQQAFDSMMHANVLGAMQALPQVAPWVQEAQGQFVFLTSDFAQIGGVESSRGWVYHVSKAALNMAVVAAQPDYPKAQFLLIHPGWVRTEMGTPDAPLLPEESVAAIRATVAARKTGKVGFVCSDVPYLRWDGTPFSSW